MESLEALIGTVVRVREGHRRQELEGMFGVIEHRWGDSNYTALDVRLENGQAQLFWFHQLDAVAEAVPVPFYDGS
jgi:hypothetical protein